MERETGQKGRGGSDAGSHYAHLAVAGHQGKEPVWAAHSGRDCRHCRAGTCAGFLRNRAGHSDGMAGGVALPVPLSERNRSGCFPGGSTGPVFHPGCHRVLPDGRGPALCHGRPPPGLPRPGDPVPNRRCDGGPEIPAQRCARALSARRGRRDSESGTHPGEPLPLRTELSGAPPQPAGHPAHLFPRKGDGEPGGTASPTGAPGEHLITQKSAKRTIIPNFCTNGGGAFYLWQGKVGQQSRYWNTCPWGGCPDTYHAPQDTSIFRGRGGTVGVYSVKG